MRRVLSLLGTDRGLLLEAIVALTMARAMVVVLPFRVVMRWHGLRLGVKSATTSDNRIARKIGQAVTRAARRMPFRAMCLEQALAASSMLRRRGLAVEMVLGVTRTANGGLLAHAWCSSAETTVVGTEKAREFTSLAIFHA